MKRIVMMMLVLLSAAAATAAVQERNFGDLAFGETVAATRQKLAEAGFTYSKDLDTGNTRTTASSYKGLFFGESTQVVVWHVDGKLAKTLVILLTSDAYCINLFVRLGGAMVDKYGEPDDAVDLEYGIDNTAANRDAIRSGSAAPMLLWRPHRGTKSPPDMAVSIADNLTVCVTYESPAWDAYVTEERSRQGSLL